jgi:hypothetical protein
MPEKSYSKDDLEINDKIDDNLETMFPQIIKDVHPKDDIKNIMSKREQLKKKLDEQTARVSKEMKIMKKKDFWNTLWHRFLYFVNIDTYVEFIQRFEDLLFVIFVDIVLVSILFSLVNLLYISITVKEFDDLSSVIIKLVASISVCILGVIIQKNLSEPKKEG